MKRLLPLLAVLLLLGACNQFSTDGSVPADVAEALDLAPADAVMLAFARPAAFESAAVQFGAAAGAEASAMVDSVLERMAQMGLDPVRNVDYVAVTGSRQAAPVGFARIRISEQDVADAMARMAPDATVKRVGTHTEWTMTAGDGSGPGTLQMVMTANGLMAIAAGEGRAAAFLSDGPARGGIRSDLAASVWDFDAWAVAQGVQDLQEHMDDVPQPFATLLTAIADVAGGGRMLDGTAQARLVLVPRDGVEASDLAEVVEGGIAAARAFDELPEALREQLDAVRVRTSAGMVLVEGSANLDLLKELLSTIRQ